MEDVGATRKKLKEKKEQYYKRTYLILSSWIVVAFALAPKEQEYTVKPVFKTT